MELCKGCNNETEILLPAPRALQNADGTGEVIQELCVNCVKNMLDILREEPKELKQVWPNVQSLIEKAISIGVEFPKGEEVHLDWIKEEVSKIESTVFEFHQVFISVAGAIEDHKVSLHNTIKLVKAEDETPQHWIVKKQDGEELKLFTEADDELINSYRNLRKTRQWLWDGGFIMTVFEFWVKEGESIEVFMSEIQSELNAAKKG